MKRNGSRSLLLCASAASALLPMPMGAQVTAIPLGDARCDRCRIELTRVVVLGQSTGSGFVGSTYNFAATKDYYLLVLASERNTIRVFDRAGNFVSTLGNHGKGPGEFEHIRGIAARLDSLYVGDASRRLTVYTPTLEHARSMMLPGPSIEGGVVPLSSGHLLLNAFVGSAAAFGHPLHMLGADGVLLKSFGGHSGVTRAEDIWGINGMRWPTIGVDASIWTVRFQDYVIEEFSQEGVLLQRLVRSPPWLDDRGVRKATSTRPPRPLTNTVGIRQAPDRLLWILGRAADPRWESAMAREGSGDRVVWKRSDRIRLWDGIIEIVDPETRELLVSQRFDHEFLGFLDVQHVLSYNESIEGVPELIVWRLTLHGR